MALHRVDREIEHGGDFFQGLVEHVLEDHHAALHGRKLHGRGGFGRGVGATASNSPTAGWQQHGPARGAALTFLAPFPRAREGGRSASGIDPAAPARSYRVGRFTTRSKALAEGRTALTLLAPFRRPREAAPGAAADFCLAFSIWLERRRRALVGRAGAAAVVEREDGGARATDEQISGGVGDFGR